MRLRSLLCKSASATPYTGAADLDVLPHSYNLQLGQVQFADANPLLRRRFSPNIQAIVVLDSKKVRRAKLYYLRDRQPKEYRVATKT